MPFRAAQRCKHGGCWQPTANGRFCATHAGNVRATRPWDAFRGSSASRGYDAAWRRVRLIALERDRWQCQECLKRSMIRRATDVHHLITVADAPDLRLELTNLVSLCHECHSSITATRDSTFARRK